MRCQSSTMLLEDFEANKMQAEETRIFLRRFGSGWLSSCCTGFRRHI